MKGKSFWKIAIIVVVCIIGWNVINDDSSSSSGGSLFSSGLEKSLAETLPEDLTTCYCIDNAGEKVLNTLEVKKLTIDRQTTNDNLKTADCTIELEGNVFQIIEFQHVKPGKGAAFVRTKYRNILSGATREEAFNPNDKFPKAHIETKVMQYLYNDGEVYYVMDVETFDQITLPMEDNKDAFKFVRENTTVKVLSYNGSVFGVEPENFVVLEVTETEPGVKGNTATNVTKAATVETGAVVQVPIFIEAGEKIQIDTRTGDYLGRAK